MEGYAETQIYSRLHVERIFAFFVRPIMDCRRGHKGGETGENPHPIRGGVQISIGWGKILALAPRAAGPRGC